MERVIENNKLIAEFMNGTYYKHVDMWDIMSFYVESQEMNFHISWDWLMPVLDKIKDCIEPNAFNVSINSEWVEIRMNSQLSMALDYPFDAIEHDGGIEGVYKSVLDFIKWHKEYLLSTDKTKTAK